MMKTLTMIASLLAFGPGAVLAEADCFVPMAHWQPRAAVARFADAQGWTVDRIKIDDGCYQIDGTDAKGRRIEVTIQPETFSVLEMEYEDHDADNASSDDEAADD